MTDVYFTSSQTWQIPSDCRKINWVRVYGGGAGGQGSGNGGYNFPGNGGSGGGGGGFAQSPAFATTPGATCSIQVGGGGAGGAAANSNGGASTGSWGGAGGDSFFYYYGGVNTYMAYARGGSANNGGSAAYGAFGYNGGTGGVGANGYSGGSWRNGGGGGGGGACGNPNYGTGNNGGNGSQSYPGAGGNGDGQYGGGGGAGGRASNEDLGLTANYPGNAGGYYGGGGGGGGAGSETNAAGLGYATNGQPGGNGAPGLVWVNYTPVNWWSDTALVTSQAKLAARASLLHPTTAPFGVGSGIESQLSSPQQYINTLLSPTSTLQGDAPVKYKGLFAHLMGELAWTGHFAGPMAIEVKLQPNTSITALDTVAYQIAASLVPQLIFTPFLSQSYVIASFANLVAISGEVSKPMLPESLHVNWPIRPRLGSDIFPARFIASGLVPEAVLASDIDLVVYDWTNFGSQVLYESAAGLEKAMADVDTARLTAIDAEAIIDSWDPYAIDISLLPYLAWAMGATFWNDQWSDETKRAWTASQWQFKALRGTNAGIEMAVDFAGRDVSPYGYYVRDIIAAPQGQYPSPGITEAEQEAWLNSLPQVRVYLAQQYGARSPAEFYMNASFLPPSSEDWIGDCFMTPSDATDRLGRRAVWNVGGVDTDVAVTDFGSYFQLHMPGQAYDEEAYVDETFPQFSFITPDDSWKRLITIAPQTVGPYRIAVGPSYQAVQSQPELVSVPGVAGYDFFVGSNLYPHDGSGVFMAPSISTAPEFLRDPQSLPLYPSFLLPDTSQYRLYERYSVYDPDDLPTGSTQGTMFMGYGWFDFAPFTAEVDVSMPSQRSSAEFAIDDFMLPSGRYTLPQDNDPIAYVSSAINAAKALRDLTLLQPKPTPIFSAGNPFLAGIDSYIVGQAQLDD